MSVPLPKLCPVIEDETEFTRVAHRGPLGVGTNRDLVQALPERIIFDHLMWRCIRHSSPDRLLPVLGHVELPVSCSNREGEIILLWAVPAVTGFVSQKQETTHPSGACTFTCTLQFNWNSSTLHTRQFAISLATAFLNRRTSVFLCKKFRLSRQKGECNIINSSEESGWASVPQTR